MSNPITGINTHLVLDNASGVPTDISAYCDRVSPATNTPEQSVRVFKSQRAYKISGTPEEDWTIEGPWTPEAHAFFRALAGTDAGKGIDYVYGPDGNTTGKTKMYGTCNCTHYSHGESQSEAVKRFEARLSIITQNDGTF